MHDKHDEGDAKKEEHDLEHKGAEGHGEPNGQDLHVPSSTGETHADATGEPADIKLEQFEEDILGETIDVDRQDDIVEDYFEAAYDELAEDGSANHEDVNSFDSVESESFASRNDLEDKRPSGVISDDEEDVDDPENPGRINREIGK